MEQGRKPNIRYLLKIAFPRSFLHDLLKVNDYENCDVLYLEVLEALGLQS